MKELVLAIVGPTASGKTTLGLQLAHEQKGEIVSVDSKQVYRYLTVGTAKPTGHWTQGAYRVEGIPYHLVDFLEPDQPFSAAEFTLLAQAKMEEIEARGHRPVLVGGTGFYFRALMEGLAPLPPADAAVRRELREI